MIMMRVARPLALLLLLAPGRASAQLQEMRQTIFGMD
jgi:hypothetical protein